MMVNDIFEIAGPEYLFDNVQFIWSVVKQGVEGVALCEEQLKINYQSNKGTMIYVNIPEENIVP